jgi:hypothetical protein
MASPQNYSSYAWEVQFLSRIQSHHHLCSGIVNWISIESDLVWFKLSKIEGSGEMDMVKSNDKVTEIHF